MMKNNPLCISTRRRSLSPLRQPLPEGIDHLTTKYPSPHREDPFREDPFSTQFPSSPKREDPRFRSRSPSPPQGSFANLPPPVNFLNFPPPTANFPEGDIPGIGGNFPTRNPPERNTGPASSLFDRLDERDRLMLEEDSQNQASFNDRLDERDRILLAESNQR